jgi:hypothetical protein
VNPTGGIREPDDGGAQLLGFFDGVDSHVTGAGNCYLGAIKRVTMGLHHFLGEIDTAIPGGFGAHQGTTPGEPLTGEHAGFVLVGKAAIHTEQVADFPAADANIAGGNVPIFTNMVVEFGHEGLTEPHDFGIGLAFGVEVSAALAAADGQTGKRVLEDLFETKEFDDAKVDGRVEAEPTLIGAKRRVELHPEAAVNLNNTLIVHPGNTEHKLSLWFAQPLNETIVRVVGILV